MSLIWPHVSFAVTGTARRCGIHPRATHLGADGEADTQRGDQAQGHEKVPSASRGRCGCPVGHRCDPRLTRRNRLDGDFRREE